MFELSRKKIDFGSEISASMYLSITNRIDLCQSNFLAFSPEDLLEHDGEHHWDNR